MSIVTGAVIFSNFGSFKDFPHPDKAVALGGLGPSVVESGRLKGGVRHLSKQGSPHLRQALYPGGQRGCPLQPCLGRRLQEEEEAGLEP